MPEASTLLIEIPEQHHEMPVGDPGHGHKRKRNDADLEEERKGKIRERTAEQKTACNERTKARHQQRAAAQKEMDAEKQKARRDNPIYRAKNAQEQKKSSANMSEEKKAKRKAQQLELASTPAAKAANALIAKKHRDNMPEERRGRLMQIEHNATSNQLKTICSHLISCLLTIPLIRKLQLLVRSMRTSSPCGNNSPIYFWLESCQEWAYVSEGSLEVTSVVLTSRDHGG